MVDIYRDIKETWQILTIVEFKWNVYDTKTCVTTGLTQESGSLPSILNFP